MKPSHEDFVQVPAGPFIYGPEECYERLEQCPPLQPQQLLDLPEFWIARQPVTYAEWHRFLQDTKHPWQGTWYQAIAGWRGMLLRGYAPTNHYPTGHDSFPMVDVTQADAYAYCEWLSAQLNRTCTLPTEQQWEKAARGTDGRIYPWGNDLPRTDIQWQKRFPVGLETYFYSLVVSPCHEWARAGWYWRNGRPWPVGSQPRNTSPYGCLDMSGNIWEWTSSLYNPDLPDYHVVKGGSWGYSIHHTRLNVRSACSVTTPSRQYHAQGTGFRPIMV